MNRSKTCGVALIFVFSLLTLFQFELANGANLPIYTHLPDLGSQVLHGW